MFAFGLEHEVAFLDRRGQFVDFASTSFAELNALITDLPYYDCDDRHLHFDELGIKRKRWYIEGFERFSESGAFVSCHAKGIEIRTTIHPTIWGAVQELTESFLLLSRRARHAGFVPVVVSFHPYRTAFVAEPPLNYYEQRYRSSSPETRSAGTAMLTYGPDLNLSYQGLSTAALLDLGCKLTAYSPYIIPFSFSSPFYAGTLWDGLSVRTFIRTGARAAVRVFLDQEVEPLGSVPSFTKTARLPAEAGRIEFKACDSCANFALYASLLALLKGLVLDQTLSARTSIPDTALHQQCASLGFASQEIAAGTQQVLQAVARALYNDPDASLLNPLYRMFQQRITPAHQLISAFQHTGSIEKALRSPYETSFD
ncbi:MAG: glutamate--cysteine ligase [Chloroflexi bacterium]|nr:glutamate--cysteine ligase [Ktedonobacteraceae bacterium]MBV9020760.1 glutamate--cysteine ligase [Ktedonobacteraceae bacterium]MBV9707245.1 glutamate--cysteine ligase [Chloroflexota bacterium]